MPAKKKDCKIKTLEKVTRYLDEYKQILLCEIKDIPADMVHKARKLLRDIKSEMVCGKSTVMIKAINLYLESKKKLPTHHTAEGLKKVVECIPGMQIALVFSNSDTAKVHEITSKFLVEKQAKVGAISPIEVTLPAGPTGMDASQIDYFQALKIPTKVVKNQLEVMSPTKILTIGQKISMSEINLMKKFNIKPYKHNVQVKKIYLNGKVYGEEILKINDNYLKERIEKGITNIACLSLRLNIPTKASAPHLIATCFKNLAGLAVSTNSMFKQAEALVSGASESAPKKEEKKEDVKGKKEKEAPKVEAPKEEVEEEMPLFDF